MHPLMKAALFPALLALAACATKPQDPVSEPATQGKVIEPNASIEAKQIAAENEAAFVTEIEFPSGSSALSPEAKVKVSDIVNSAKKKGEVDEFMVLSWSDRDLPAADAERLPEAQRELADKRNRALSSFLRAATKDADVETYNMAEKSNALEKMFGTTDARLKRSLRAAGLPESSVGGKASKAIVMVILEDDNN